MRICIRVLVLFATSVISAQIRAEAISTEAASTNQPVVVTETPAAQDNLSFIGNLGLTRGGSTLYTVQLADGSSQAVSAGAFFEVGGGMLWHVPDRPLSLQVTANWHGDSAGKNSSASFSRYPLEGIAYYHPGDTFRFGMGIRYVFSPISNAKIDGGGETIHFKNALGTVLEAGYRIDKDDWVNLRVVREKYQPESCSCGGKIISVQSSPSVNGFHVGVNWIFRFGNGQGGTQAQSLSANQTQRASGGLLDLLFDGIFGVSDEHRTHDNEHNRHDDTHEDRHKEETVTRNIVITPDLAK